LAGQADVLVRIPAPTPKSSDNGGLRSIQPMADLFEGALGLLLGALIMQLKGELGVSEEQMFARHANLE
jgi:6-phospho-3-hexuloisomerase